MRILFVRTLAAALVLVAGCREPESAGTPPDPAPASGPGIADSIEGRGECITEPPFHEGLATSLPAARTPDGRPLRLADVVGEYGWHFGYGGGSMSVFPDGTWYSQGGGCTSSYWRRGVARVVEGRLVLETRDKAGLLTGRTSACIPVWWGGRICLVGEGDVENLANSANWGESDSIYVHNSLLTTDGSVPELAEGTPSGPPLLPPEWERFVLQKPIRGVLTEIVEPGIAFVSLGAKDGVFPRMLLRVGRSTGYVTVVSVEETRCQVVAWLTRDHELPSDAAVWCDARGAGMPK